MAATTSTTTPKGMKPTKKSSKNGALPTFRHPDSGWKDLAALFYAIAAELLGLRWMLQYASSSNYYAMAAAAVPAILFSLHGRILASYLVHESCHCNVFVQRWANKAFGNVCLFFAGCPYANWEHIKYMHDAHHKDRADPVEFDYRDFVKKQPGVVRNTVLGLEWACIPIVETIMHFRVFLSPLVQPIAGTMTPGRRLSALIGAPVTLLFHMYLWQHGALLPQLIMGALLLHFLSFSDSFQHTYQAVMIKDYVPGPGERTFKYEEENTYSNVMSTDFPLLNALALNFGYHNAHHKKPMLPWYGLPAYHDKLYGGLMSPAAMKQLLPFSCVLKAWFVHRVRRVLDDDYGVVHPPGTPGRTNDFVGSLGVSFLTV
jgi:fatty acid desaturase